MKLNRWQQTLFLLVALALTVVAFVLLKTDSTQDSSHQETPAQNETSPISEKAWPTYVDEALHYSIQYPTGLKAIPLTNGSGEPGPMSELDPDGGVSFADLGPGVMGVKVYTDVPFTSLEEWLAAENMGKEHLRKEKIVTIDGREALVTYNVSVMSDQEELFVQEKRAIILKDGNLYEIWTKFYDDESNHARAWNSFRFLTDENL